MSLAFNSLFLTSAKISKSSHDESILQALSYEVKQWVVSNKDNWLAENLISRKAAMEAKRKISVYDLREEKRINVGMDDIATSHKVEVIAQCWQPTAMRSHGVDLSA
jgi:hypothetical protein